MLCPICYSTYLKEKNEEDGCYYIYDPCDCGSEKIVTPWQLIRTVIPELPEVPDENVKYQIVVKEKR